MHIKPVIGLAVGPVDDSHWGQVLMSPLAYGIVEIADPAGGAQQKGANLLARIGEKVSKPLASLAEVEAVANAVWESSIRTLIILVPVGRVVYIVLRGQGRVYVKRGQDLASLMHADGAVSGEVRKDDVVLLVSHGFSRLLSQQEIIGVFDHLPAPEVAEKLTLLLHEKPEGEGSVALVFDVHHLEEAANVSGKTAPPAEAPPLRRFHPKIHHVWDGLKRKGRGIVGRLKDIRHHPRALSRIAVIGLIVLFVVSVIAGIWKQANAKQDQKQVAALADARHAFEEGTALIELNPIKGRERLSEAKASLDSVMPSVNPRTKMGRDITQLYGQITDNLTQAMQITKAPLSLFYDMELIKKGARADSVALEGKSLVVGDQAGVTLYYVNIETKKAEVLGGGEGLVGISSVSLHGPQVYALTADGIMKIGVADKKLSLAVKKDDAWANVSSLTSFGGNLYVLDTTKSRIWKYVATTSGFSELREYLNADTLPDLTPANNMTIDGIVWVGTKIGAIMKFVQGREESFVPKGVEPALGTDLTVYVTDETNNVYVLDRSGSRVVVLDKDGVYVAQYQFEAESRVNAFVVSEEQKKILLLVSGKIYSIDLK